MAAVAMPPEAAVVPEDPWAAAWRWSSIAALAVLAVLVVTGVVLYWTYRPSAGQAWDDVAGLGAAAQWERVLHRVAAQALVPLSLAATITGVGAMLRARRQPWPLAVVVLAVVASITGYLLPWDQLALWAVTVGTNMRGMDEAMTSDHVRFVLIGGAEISPSTLRRSFVAHVGVSLLLIGAIIPGLRLRIRRR